MKFNDTIGLKEEWNTEGDMNKLMATLKQAIRPNSKLNVSINVDDNGKIKFKINGE
jgi:hypothetical protein